MAAAVVTLVVSGYFILMVHPRLYWGQAGNDLMPALIELPISRNHRPEGWETAVVYSELASAPVSAVRTYEAEMFNENGWARSLHFLAAWGLVAAGFLYAALSVGTGHLRRNLLPRVPDLAPRALWRDLQTHVRSRFDGSAPYGRLQRLSYLVVAFAVLPFMVLTGLTMSPAVTAAYPVLLDVFGGHQSARTLHFFGFAVLVLFLLVHVAMVVSTGFFKQMRAMTTGR